MSDDLLLERLKTFDEITLLELLEITPEDILSKFKGRIHQRREFLYSELEILSNDDYLYTDEEDELSEDTDY